MDKIVVAVIACDFKAYSLQRVLNNNLSLKTPRGATLLHYLNVECRYGGVWPIFECDDRVEVDLWTWRAQWRGKRGHDQDQGYRLPPITIARNMALEYAKYHDAGAILFIDSDVVVPENSAVVLWEELQRSHRSPFNIVGGLVPGRGCHSHVFYTGSTGPQPVAGEKHLVRVDYGTAGFVMIHKDVFWNVPWRWGCVPNNPKSHSEDPLFGHDARKLGFGWWYIRTDLKAEHLDDPERPLENGETAGF